MGYIIVKAAGCLGNYAATILVLGLTPSDSDCLQHNFLAAMLYYYLISKPFFAFSSMLELKAESIMTWLMESHNKRKLRNCIDN